MKVIDSGTSREAAGPDMFLVAMTHSALVGVKDAGLAACQELGDQALTQRAGRPDGPSFGTVFRRFLRLISEARISATRLHADDPPEVEHMDDLIRFIGPGHADDPMPFGHPRAAVVQITRDELAVVTAWIDAAVEHVEDWEFPTLVGLSKQEARLISGAMSAAVES